jgi:hypothetical protein
MTKKEPSGRLIETSVQVSNGHLTDTSQVRFPWRIEMVPIATLRSAKRNA